MNNAGILLLKAAIDFNSQIMIIATQLVATNTPVSMRGVEREVQLAVNEYQKKMEVILGVEKKESNHEKA